MLQMLKHGRAGVPMEVMGLMLGEFVDEYTVHVVDVFAMPQSGTTVSVESVDHVFQTRMMEMLKQTGRYVWKSSYLKPAAYELFPAERPSSAGTTLTQGLDAGYQAWILIRSRLVRSHEVGEIKLTLWYQSFESLDTKSVAVVIDPIQSVKGKVVIDAFRLIQPQTVVSGQEPRQTTSNIGHINKPSIQALIHGLNRHYYSIAVNYRKTELEQSMLMNLHKRNWTEGLTLRDFKNHKEGNEKSIKVRVMYSVRQIS